MGQEKSYEIRGTELPTMDGVTYGLVYDLGEEVEIDQDHERFGEEIVVDYVQHDEIDEVVFEVEFEDVGSEVFYFDQAWEVPAFPDQDNDSGFEYYYQSEVAEGRSQEVLK